jgi:PAS domain S-box-containing protein
VPGRIVVASDISDDREKLRELLETEEFQVVAAEDGVSAMALLEREAADGVLAKLIMPDMDGLALCRQIKNRSEPGRIPVFLYSRSLAGPQDRDLVLSQGADRFIADPFASHDWIAELRHAARKGEARHPAPQPAGRGATGGQPPKRRYSPDLIRRLEDRIHSLENERFRQKAAEERLTDREAEYQMIFAHTNEVILIIDRDFTIQSISPSVERLIGYRPEDLVNRPFAGLDIIAPEYLEAALADARRVNTGERIESAVYEMVCRDGTRRFAEFSGAPIFREGRIAGQINVARDITEKKQAEQALRESEEKFRNIAETSRDIIFQLAPDGRFTYVSPSAEQIFGYSQESIVGSRILSYAAPVDLERATAAFESAISGNRIELFEFQAVRSNGGLVPLEVSAAPIARSGEIIGIQGIARDVSERKAAEFRQQELEDQIRQAQKMEAIGTLAGGIAHDFNNILASIIGYTELSIDDLDPETGLYKYLAEVLKGGYRARDLVRQILTFSRKTEEDKKPVQVKLMVKESIKLLRSSLPSNIRIEDNVASDALVLCHPTHIHQILMNLSTNAAHAMEPDGGVLRIDLEDVHLDSEAAAEYHQIQAGQYLLLAVSDTGVGMSDTIIPQIFDPYFTTREKGSGTGLGLSVVHGMVTALGGQITVESRPGKGSTFRLLLPSLPAAVPSSDAAIQASAPGGTERILAVDDEPPLVEMLQQMLSQLGYRVTTRTGSLDALALFRENPDAFDLVITDMMMPELTGTALARSIRSIRPDMPVVLLTGYSEQIDEKTAASEGIRAYALKPVIKHKLARLLREVLDKDPGQAG